MKVSSSSVDDMWEYFKQTLLTGMNEFIPRTKQPFNKNKNFQPFNSDLNKLIHQKHTLCLKKRAHLYSLCNFVKS